MTWKRLLLWPCGVCFVIKLCLSIWKILDDISKSHGYFFPWHDVKEIVVYVDDMIVNFREGKSHSTNLRKLFERLKKYQLKLNPLKWTFKVTSKKLLGFFVSSHGIKVDQAIQFVPVPHTKKEVRGFIGQLNYISWFISQLTDKCDPIFKLLKKHDFGE